MTSPSETTFEVLKIALVVGVLGDILLRATPWGLNALLFNIVFVGAFAVLLWRNAPERLTASTIALMGAQVFFSAMFVWRDSDQLHVADTLAIVAILSIQLIPQLGVTQRLAGTFHYGVGFIWSSLSAFFAPVALLMSDVEWSNLPNSGWRKHVFAVARGLAIATPLVLIFGGLFMAADAAYEGMIQRAFNIDLAAVFTHALLFSVFTWLSAGYLRGAVISPLGAAVVDAVTDESADAEMHTATFSDVKAEAGEPPVTLPGDRTVVEHMNISDPPDGPETETRPVGSVPSSQEKKWTWSDISNSLLPQTFTLGTTEVAVILGLMNLLFLSFVIVQVPYLFGGMELVQNTPDFKLAEYARRGFGELVAVSALVLPTLLAGQWLIRKEATRAQFLFKVLAGTQIALLFVIMASAVQRLVLLTGNLGYGLTTVRLYPLIFMSWLAIVFVWFGVTVLRGARQHFAWGALWSAFFVLGGTHVLNPDAFIVQTNLALMREGRQFDAKYNSAELSSDALPILLASFDQLNEDDQQEAITNLGQKYCRMREERGLRSWNASRQRVWQVLNRNIEFVEALNNCESTVVDKPMAVADQVKSP